MTAEALVEECKQRYEKGGFKALSYPELKKDGIYFHLFAKGISQKKLLELLQLKGDYGKFRRANFSRVVNGKVQAGWTWERVLEEVGKVVNLQGFIPPAEWFSRNRHASLVQAIYSVGKTFEDLRTHFSSFKNSDFVESRNGMRWRSHPEASLSNFLYARGVEHKRGEKYPQEFAAHSKQGYGYYDLHFRGKNKDWMDVEIWGEKPNGHNAEGYAVTRLSKERFNKGTGRFLGIEFRDCFREENLTKILKPHIGIIDPFVFERPHDRSIHTTHWSNADELIAYCQEFVKQFPDGKFPAEDWLRKRGRWKDREGPAYNTLSVYIKLWIGGVRMLRDILGQAENSTATWTKETAISAYREWYKKYGFVPGSVRRKNKLPELERKWANCIDAAVNKYAGGPVKVQLVLGIKPYRPRAKS